MITDKGRDISTEVRQQKSKDRAHKARHMYTDGYTVDQIAESILISSKQVRRYLKDICKEDTAVSMCCACRLAPIAADGDGRQCAQCWANQQAHDEYIGAGGVHKRAFGDRGVEQNFDPDSVHQLLTGRRVGEQENRPELCSPPRLR